ncbi:MAG: hypothetical protein KFF46_02225 [Desulfobacterales bacterium]|nr:hypothetical protein [Desulfobacterales bacterium]
MTQKKRNPSFDAMIKFFLKQYNIATKTEINRLTAKIEELEKTVRKLAGPQSPKIRRSSGKTASDQVLNVISDMPDGARLADVKSKTDFDEKKLRNIIYRLGKQGKIKRKRRGIYVAT